MSHSVSWRSSATERENKGNKKQKRLRKAVTSCDLSSEGWRTGVAGCERPATALSLGRFLVGGCSSTYSHSQLDLVCESRDSSHSLSPQEPERVREKEGICFPEEEHSRAGEKRQAKGRVRLLVSSDE